MPLYPSPLYEQDVTVPSRGCTTANESGRIQIAIVDDDPFMAQLVSDMLSFNGVTPEVFPLGEDLLHSANMPNFTHIILDLSIPDIDGFDLMDALATTITSGTSIFIMSGHDESVLQAAKLYGTGLGLNICGAMTKPFSRVELLATLGFPV